MLHLLKIDLKKLTNYRTFWVVCGLYFGTMAFTTSSGMEVLKWITSKGAQLFGPNFNINKVPLYHFPDVWQNIVYVSGYFKIMLGIMVVISITNEFTYRTVRQNIIDGMSRWEFLFSKILMNFLLSLASAAIVFLIGLVTGLIYTPDIVFANIFKDLSFFIAYFLEVFTFLSFALMMGILVQRSGLTIIILLISRFIEFLFKLNVPDSAEGLKAYFPMESISNLVPIPFPKYILMEIQDYVSVAAIFIAIGWAVLFNYFSYLKLSKSDI